MSWKFIEVFPVLTVIFSSLSLKRVISFFLYLSKELPDADRITASPSSRYNPTLEKSMLLWISVSMFNPTSSHICAPSLAPIDTSN